MKTATCWLFPTEPLSRDLAAYPPLLAKVLHARGLRDYWSAERFLAGTPCLADPYLMLGMKAAVQPQVQVTDFRKNESEEPHG